ncbi:hypothetical protein EVAR_26944_1 [Eumeta japonica]|uniref:Uncharacterized protein n=1 Tax=Eumeta variegata TaxID=151549 RepID=A0A4C1VJ75_EUMVA|nr:hypothetical protein EVAR_26944_1 [Eumeta japonica]
MQPPTHSLYHHAVCRPTRRDHKKKTALNTPDQRIHTEPSAIFTDTYRYKLAALSGVLRPSPGAGRFGPFSI